MTEQTYAEILRRLAVLCDPRNQSNESRLTWDGVYDEEVVRLFAHVQHLAVLLDHLRDPNKWPGGLRALNAMLVAPIDSSIPPEDSPNG